MDELGSNAYGLMLVLTDPIEPDHVRSKAEVLCAQQAAARDYARDAPGGVGASGEADEVDAVSGPILAHDLGVAVDDALADAAAEGGFEQLDEAAGIRRHLRSRVGTYGGKHGLRAA